MTEPKVLTIEELQSDLANLVAQANSVQGAMQYVAGKITQLKKVDEAEPEEDKE